MVKKKFDLEAEMKKLRKKTYTGGGGESEFRGVTISFKPKKEKKGEK